jgi:hypothetical protein
MSEMLLNTSRHSSNISTKDRSAWYYLPGLVLFGYQAQLIYLLRKVSTAYFLNRVGGESLQNNITLGIRTH